MSSNSIAKRFFLSYEKKVKNYHKLQGSRVKIINFK